MSPLFDKFRNKLIKILVAIFLLIQSACTVATSPTTLAPTPQTSTPTRQVKRPTNTPEISFETITSALRTNGYDLLVINGQYWTNALRTDYGGGKKYTGFTDVEDDQGISFAGFIDATPVRLLEVRERICKVEGQEWEDNKIVRGWVDCSRLLPYEPTPVPFNEVKLGP